MLVDGELFKRELVVSAVRWQLWISLMVGVVLFEMELIAGAVGWLSCLCIKRLVLVTCLSTTI